MQNGQADLLRDRIRSLDDDHRALLEAMSPVISHPNPRNGRLQALEFLKFARAHILDHFASEEAVMLAYGYPETRAHRMEHQGLLDAVAIFSCQLLDGSASLKSVNTSTVALCNALVTHLREADRELAGFLESLGDIVTVNEKPASSERSGGKTPEHPVPDRAGPAPAESPAETTGVHALPFISQNMYEIEGEIARGGLGRILKARDRRDGRIVALKELLYREPGAKERFAQEIRLTMRLRHPNIVSVREAGRWPSGDPFYSMDFLEGASLKSLIDRAADLTARLALLPRIVDVTEAIGHAHDLGIIHRDVKPANVLVGRNDETLVIDWGLAKEIGANDLWPARTTVHGGYDTSDGTIAGTPSYMPPEQAASMQVDERADVYAVGAMLYHLLTGWRPYETSPPQDVPAAVLAGPPIQPQELAPDLPVGLLRLIDKAMQRSPSDRFANGTQLNRALKQLDVA